AFSEFTQLDGAAGAVDRGGPAHQRSALRGIGGADVARDARRRRARTSRAYPPRRAGGVSPLLKQQGAYAPRSPILRSFLNRTRRGRGYHVENEAPPGPDGPTTTAPVSLSWPSTSALWSPLKSATLTFAQFVSPSPVPHSCVAE